MMSFLEVSLIWSFRKLYLQLRIIYEMWFCCLLLAKTYSQTKQHADVLHDAG